MKLKGKIKLLICGVMSIATIGTLSVLSQAVHAKTSGSQGAALQIAPYSNKTGELKPGDTYEGTFELHNENSAELKYKVYATGYGVTDESYSSAIYPEDGTYSKIAKWITLSKTSGTLKGNETVEIKYTINVPQDAPGGGQYAVIMAETDSDDEDTIQVSTRLGMVLYSHISGQVVTCSKITSVNLNTFLVTPPINFSSVVENCGNIDLDAKYILRVFPLFSNEEVYTNEESPDVKTILPETKRFNNVAWENSPSFGVYRVEYEVQVGDQVEKGTQYVIICPIWLIVIILLFIGSIVFWFFARRRERKDAAEASKASATKDVKKDDKPSDK